MTHIIPKPDWPARKLKSCPNCGQPDMVEYKLSHGIHRDISIHEPCWGYEKTTSIEHSCEVYLLKKQTDLLEKIEVYLHSAYKRGKL